MENMNLASRCREAISQVAALKKEVMVYQKQQSNVATLQKEVIQLRKQIDGKSGGSGHKKQPSSGSVGSPGNNSLNNGVKDHKKQSSSGGGSGGKSSNLENNNADRSDSPATDLDRIMSRQFRKQQDRSASSAAAVTATKSAKGDGAHKNTSVGGSNTSSTTPTTTTGNSSTNKLLTSANTKIPISVTSSKSKHSTTKNATTPSSAASSTTQNDDEFDADIDMVDFFAKSQLNSESPSSSLESTTHLGSRKTHSRKPKSTDDHMPGDVISVGSSSSSPSSPGTGGVGLNTGGGKKTSPSDSLISSLDAFEASFASAFPETSFSITSNITSPSSSAKLDMSFDVPEFDPFFKSPNSNSHHSSAAAGGGGGHGNNLGKNTTTNGLKGSSPKMQDLFPESAMNFKSSTSPKLDIAFDSTTNSSDLGFTPIDKNKGGGGYVAKTSVAPEKLDFSRVQPKGGKSNASNKDDNIKQTTSQKRGTAGSAVPLSPQSMSAAIEQLDALAITSVPNLSSSPNENTATSGSASVDTSSNTVPSRMAGLRATRKVKQPISYAEPSTKSKLRRGDVLFPKADADNKKSGVGSGLKTTRSDSPTTDLDRIMEKITASTSSSPDVQ